MSYGFIGLIVKQIYGTTITITTTKPFLKKTISMLKNYFLTVFLLKPRVHFLVYSARSETKKSLRISKWYLIRQRKQLLKNAGIKKMRFSTHYSPMKKISSSLCQHFLIIASSVLSDTILKYEDSSLFPISLNKRESEREASAKTQLKSSSSTLK